MSGALETPSLITSPSTEVKTEPVVEAAKVEAEPAKVEETKVEPAKVEPAVIEPLTLESVKFPEGLAIDETASKSFIDILNDTTLTRAELAQKLVDLQGSVAQSMSSLQEKTWVDAQESQIAAVKADPEIGGEKLGPALGKINQLVDRYGSPELKQVFDLTGAGNNIHVIKFLAKMAGDLTEGGPVLGAAPASEKSLANSLFPSMK